MLHSVLINQQPAPGQPEAKKEQEIVLPTNPPPKPEAQEYELEYAGFWLRMGAYIVDHLFLSLIMGIAAIAVFLGPFTPSLEQTLVFIAVLCAATFLYFFLMEWSPVQGTVGKWVSGVRVTTTAGARLSFFRSFFRTLAKAFSALLFGIGFLMIGMTEHKQGLHDKIAGCYVLSYRKSRFWLAFFLLLVLSGGLSAGGGALASMKMQRSLGKGLTEVLGEEEGALRFLEEWVGQSPLFHEPVDAPAAEEEAQEEEQEVIDLGALPGTSVADYEEMLAVPAQSFAEGLRASTGPFALQLKPLLWGTSAQHGITVRMAPFLPAAVRHMAAVIVSLRSVRDTQGQEMGESDRFREPMFNEVKGFEKRGEAFEGAYGNVRLLREAKDAEIARIEGDVVVRLPVGMKVASFEAGESGATRTLGNAEVTLTEAGSNASFALKGVPYENVFILGLDGKGQVVPVDGFTASGDEAAGTVQVMFRGEPKMLHAVVAKSILTRELPFVMER